MVVSVVARMVTVAEIVSVAVISRLRVEVEYAVFILDCTTVRHEVTLDTLGVIVVVCVIVVAGRVHVDLSIFLLATSIVNNLLYRVYMGLILDSHITAKQDAADLSGRFLHMASSLPH
jgi:hypothetical protein